MLTVISVLGILAALTVPALKNLGKSNSAISASRQMLDAAGHARQLAIANRTTVYMIFVPTNFWAVGGLFPNNWWTRLNADPKMGTAALNLCDRQLSGYTFVAYGAAGDQPGRHVWHYLEPWQALPEGMFIALQKFALAGNQTNMNNGYPVQGFMTASIPFPTVDSSPALLPSVAFNYLGQLTFDGVNLAGRDEYIPLERGSILPAMNPDKTLQFSSPIVSEIPPGNSTSIAYEMVDVDPLTGRATLRYQKVQ